VNIHELTHAVRADVPSDDGKPDFLVNDTPPEHEIENPDHLPNVLYLSDGTTAPVTSVTSATLDGQIGEGTLQVQLTASVPGGWVYIRADGPRHGAVQAHKGCSV